ncbi:6-phosphogluconolactonase [Polynucleobacter bastaniensis]|uniref:6-phosphogluconolactonase n=1 Tax=Polynucleobacter bastaniensis TaxID=2081039 RepID=UPI0034E1F368
MNTSAKIIYREIKHNYKKNGGVRIMTAAGKAASLVHCRLAEMITAGNLKNIKMFLADERCVDKYNKFSNYRAIKKIYSRCRNVNVYHFFNVKYSAAFALKKYEKLLKHNINILVLGLAPDGHIASISFGRDAEKFDNNLIIVKREAEPFERYTINYNFIDKNCRKVYILLNNVLKRRIAKKVAFTGDKNSPLYNIYIKD